MNEDIEIPAEPLDIRYNNSGFLSHIGLHQRGQIWYQESSYSHFWFFGVMLAAAVTVCFLPWDTVAGLGVKLKYYFAGALLWGGICGAAPFFIRNAFGQTIVIEPQRRLTIRKRRSETVVPWDGIVGLQLCHQPAEPGSELAGYQLNLVWKSGAAALERRCLLKHAVKGFVRKLANQYASLFRIKVYDQTGPTTSSQVERGPGW